MSYLRVQYRNNQIPDPEFETEDPNAEKPQVWVSDPSGVYTCSVVDTDSRDIAQLMLNDNAHPSRAVFWFDIDASVRGEATLTPVYLKPAEQVTRTVERVEAQLGEETISSAERVVED